MKFLVRHGQTDFTERSLYQGTSDEPRLTEKGLEDIRNIAKQLSRIRVDSVVSAPASRALESASIINQIVGKRVEVFDCLNEIANDAWSGMAKSDIEKLYAREWETWRHSPETTRWSSSGAVLQSKADAISAYVNNFNLALEEVIVSHDHTLRTLALMASGLSQSTHRSLTFLQGSLSLMDVGDNGRWMFRALGLKFDSHQPRLVERDQATRIILVRHGATNNNFSRIYQGQRLDCGLSKEGVTQATHASSLLLDVSPLFVVTSSLLRSKETAEILAFDSQVRSDPRLNEFDYGHWIGYSEAEVQKLFPDEYAIFCNASSSAPIKDAEALPALRNRVAAGLKDVIFRLSESRVPGEKCAVIVTHDVTFRMALCVLLGLDVSHLHSFEIANGGVSVLQLTERGYWRLLQHNALGVDLVDRHDHAYF